MAAQVRLPSGVLTLGNRDRWEIGKVAVKRGDSVWSAMARALRPNA